MSTAGATGEAKDAEVVTDTGAISAEELAKRQADDAAQLKTNVTNAEAKVAKLEEALAGAKEGLATAKAELKGS